MLNMPSGTPLGQFAIVLAAHLFSEERQFKEGYLRPPIHQVSLPSATKGEPQTIITDFSLTVRPHQPPDFQLVVKPRRFPDFDLNPRRRI